MIGPLRVAVLGSTGSIGRQALEVAAAHPDKVEIVALAACRSAELLASQAEAFETKHVACCDSDAAKACSDALGRPVATGHDSVAELAALPEVDLVLNALVGAAGLRTTATALAAGKTLALANKESLVIGGELIMPMVHNGQLIPVDSEHSAIYQCLVGENRKDVSRIWLTASGGPFRGYSRELLQGVTATEALAHPTWKMGPKITIDSASLMNKGLEVIEAHHLFNVAYEDIRVVVHPQSCVHSMVEYSDGSVKAHLGATDMRIPIQYAFSHPRRWDAPIPPVDFAQIGRLDFAEPDIQTFGCLRLAFESGKVGGTAPVVLNAANEVAVAAFLAGTCSFLDIERIVEGTLGAIPRSDIESFEHIESVDAEARERARLLADCR